jgi:hypothetical protein
MKLKEKRDIELGGKPRYITKLMTSIGSICFETFKKKLLLYVIFIMMAES